MCWNEQVSLNTFLFSSFVLLLIIYNNKFTQYKIKEFNNIWKYAFFASFIFIQLIEFFIWRNINNKLYNHIFSFLTVLLILVQPVMSLMMITNKIIRNKLLSLYLLVSIPYFLYKIFTTNIFSIKSKTGHLRWLFFNKTNLFGIIWLFFFLISFVYEQFWGGLLFGLSMLIISIYNYINDHTITSMWCWLANMVMIYYAVYLLFYLPFCDKKEIC